MAQVLIIDDDTSMSGVLARAVVRMGHEAEGASTLREGMEKARSGEFDVVFLDVRMPDGNGIDALPLIREVASSPEVIIMTGLGDPDGAEMAIESGAWDYIEKPSSMKAMMLPLVRALQYRQERIARRCESGVSSGVMALKREGIIGKSPRFMECLDLLAKAAQSELNVLITGESGAGKELFAKAIHENSARSNGNLVVVDCAALPETLIESVLFGHKKGAFTGADKDRDGLIKQADGGVLFLDEVGELPLSVQKVFLRSLQERSFRPLGGKREVKSDFRLLAATNRNLEKMAELGQFREDLLFRLRALVIDLPPLRERLDDIKELAVYFLTRICEQSQMGTKGFSPEFFDVLQSYHWPGNMRELVNAMERVFVAAYDEPTLFPKHLPTYIRVQVARAAVEKSSSVPASCNGEGDASFVPLKDFRRSAAEKAEEQYLRDLMTHTLGNAEKACGIAKLQRARFYELLRKYGITASR